MTEAREIDLVARLRAQGTDAFAKHYSLGMFKLCTEAADEIERLRSDIEMLKDPNVVHINMLRGGITKPSWAQIEHLYPEEVAAIRCARGGL